MKGLYVFIIVFALFGCSETENGNCCKVCTTGKACGDTCIPKSSNCNTLGGCACNG
jgi:hypothetical protein